MPTSFRVVLIAAAVVLTGTVTARAQPAATPDWRAALATLEAVDDELAAGAIDGAVARLAAAETAGPPLPEIAAVYSKALAGAADPGSLGAGGGYGVALVANSLDSLEDEDLRADLTDRILADHGHRHDACALVLIARGNRAFRAGRHADALADFQRAVEEHGSSTQAGVAQFNLGITLRDLGRLPEAIAAFTALLAMAVDNEEMEGGSIMEMDYRNYHHRAALNIAWCHEQLGANEDAYGWIEQAKTTYPYLGWCGVEIEGSRRALARDADRIAFSGPSGLLLRHLAAVARQQWIAYALWLGWGAALWLASRRALARRPWRASATAAAAVAITAPVVYSASSGILAEPMWDGKSLALFWLRWAVGVVGLSVAAVLTARRPRAAAALAAGAAAVWLLADARSLLAFGEVLRYLDRSPLCDLQEYTLAILVPALAIVTGVVASAWRGRRSRTTTVDGRGGTA